MKNLKTRDVLKFGTKILIQRKVENKMFSALHKYYKDGLSKAEEWAKKSLQKLPSQNPQMVTPEGITIEGTHEASKKTLHLQKQQQLNPGKGAKWRKVNQKQKINWTPHRWKHFPPKNMSWKKIIQFTKHGDAKYKPGIDIESLERYAWKHGKKVVTDKNWKVFEYSEIIGAKRGIPTKFMRVEMNTNTIHGHPITPAEFSKYLGR